jgi:hypothetical protein
LAETEDEARRREEAARERLGEAQAEARETLEEAERLEAESNDESLDKTDPGAIEPKT